MNLAQIKAAEILKTLESREPGQAPQQEDYLFYDQAPATEAMALMRENELINVRLNTIGQLQLAFHRQRAVSIGTLQWVILTGLLACGALLYIAYML